MCLREHLKVRNYNYVIQSYLWCLYSCYLSDIFYSVLAFFAQSIKWFPVLLENNNIIDNLVQRVEYLV